MGSMSYTQFLFSFEGRATRSAYWLRFYLPMMVIYALMGFLTSLVMPAMDQYGTPLEAPSTTFMIMQAVFGLFAVVALWPSLAVTAKRWHDRDKSGWWTLIALIPIIGGLWMLIECGFLRGTTGSNRFGEDPLQSAGGFQQPGMEPQM